MPVGRIQGAQQPHAAQESKKEKPKESFPGMNKQMSTLAYESNVGLVEFWELVIKILSKLPFVRKQIQSTWENSIHLLQPNFNEDQPNLSALPFEAPNYFTDDMKEHVSGAIAENYQRVMQRFCAFRLNAPNTPEEHERLNQVFASLSYSSYSDCLKGEGADRCHSALYGAIEAWMDTTIEEQVHLGTAGDLKKRKTLSSDFLSAFCPQLEHSTRITQLHIHGPFAREVDRKKLLDALEKNTSIQTLHFDLDKESTAHILPFLPHLLENNPHLTEITFQNYSEKRNFVIEDSVWQSLATQVQHRQITLRFHYTPQMPQYLHFPIREKVSFEEN